MDNQELINASELKRLQMLIQEKEVDPRKVCAYFKIQRLPDLQQQYFTDALSLVIEMTQKKKSNILQTVHQSAKDLHDAQIISDREMAEYDEICNQSDEK